MFKKKSKIGDILDVIILMMLVVMMYFLPSFAFILSLTGNILMCVITYRSNIKKSIGCIMVTYAFIVVFCLTENAFSLSYLYDCVLSVLNLLFTGFSIGMMFKFTGEISKILISGTTAGLSVVMLELVRYRITYSGSALVTLINEPVKAFIGAYESVVNASGLNFDEIFGASTEDIIWAMQQSLSMILPALMILSSLILAFIVYAVSKNILGAYGVRIYTRDFCEYQMNTGTSLALVASYIISIFSASTLGAACTNILLILICLYIICGFSVVEYKFKSKIKLPILRIFIYIMAVFVSGIITMLLPFFNIVTILMVTGMFDSVYDFRKLKKEESEEDYSEEE